MFSNMFGYQTNTERQDRVLRLRGETLEPGHLGVNSSSSAGDYLTLSRLLYLSVTQFPHLSNGGKLLLASWSYEAY